MKRIMFPFLFALPFLLMACSKKKEVDQGELAGRAAKLYYEQLLKGQYEAFLEVRIVLRSYLIVIESNS